MIFASSPTVHGRCINTSDVISYLPVKALHKSNTPTLIEVWLEFVGFPRPGGASVIADSRMAIRRARKNIAMIHAPRLCTRRASIDPELRGTRVVGLSYFLSRRPREVYSEATPRRDVQHPRRVRNAPWWLPYCMSHCRRAPRRRETTERKRRRRRKRR